MQLRCTKNNYQDLCKINQCPEKSFGAQVAKSTMHKVKKERRKMKAVS